MKKYFVSIKPVGDVQYKYSGSGDFVSTVKLWDEEWTVTDESGAVIDRQIVERMDTVGHNGLSDHWGVCTVCGSVAHLPSIDVCCVCNDELSPRYDEWGPEDVREVVYIETPPGE